MKYLQEIYKSAIRSIDDDIEYILRNYVEPPIKGEITHKKLKNLDITIVHSVPDFTFTEADNCVMVNCKCWYAVKQRDYLFFRDGTKIHKDDLSKKKPLTSDLKPP